MRVSGSHSGFTLCSVIFWEIIKQLEKFPATFKNCHKYSLKSRRWNDKPIPGNNQRRRFPDCPSYISRLVHSGFTLCSVIFWEIIKQLEKFPATFKNCHKYSLKSRRWNDKPIPGNNQRRRFPDCPSYISRLVHSGFRIH